MSYIDIFNQRNAAYGSTVRQTSINNNKRSIIDSFKDSPSYYQVQVTTSSTPTTSSPLDVWIVDDSKTKELKQIQAIPNKTLNYGDLVLWYGDYWLTLTIDNMGDIYYRGSISKCISSIKWLDENGIVKEAPFAYDSLTARGLGLIEGNVMPLAGERRYIIVQNNIDTVKIEKGKRFIFDNRSWRVTSIDRLNTGLVNFELEEIDINPAIDNVDLRIADYVGNVANYTLKIVNGGNLSLHAGQTYQLNVEVKNNGVLNNRPLTFTSSNPSIATVSSTGIVTTIANGNVTITVSLTENTSIKDSSSITIQLVTSSNYTVSVIGDDAMYCNTSKTYDRQVKNNGVVDNSRFVQWYLYSDDGVTSTTLASATFSSTTQCTVTANNKNQSGYVKLKAVVIGSSTVVDVKRIAIKSLI